MGHISLKNACNLTFRETLQVQYSTRFTSRESGVPTLYTLSSMCSPYFAFPHLHQCDWSVGDSTLAPRIGLWQWVGQSQRYIFLGEPVDPGMCTRPTLTFETGDFTSFVRTSWEKSSLSVPSVGWEDLAVDAPRGSQTRVMAARIKHGCIIWASEYSHAWPLVFSLLWESQKPLLTCKFAFLGNKLALRSTGNNSSSLSKQIWAKT